jgi:hypothetical protein
MKAICKTVKAMVRAAAIPGFMICSAAMAASGPWTIETVDATAAARYTSLRIDKDGNVHVAYVLDDGNTYPLKYGFWDHNLKSWFVMTVAKLAAQCSLTLDSKQRPNISYVGWSDGKLHYTYWDSGWKEKPIPLPSELISYYNSITLDAHDNPTISFYEYRGPKDSDLKIRLRTVTWNGQYWGVRTVDPEEGSGKFNSMATGPDGRIHLAYANVGAANAGMRYAYWDGATWHLEVVEGMDQTQGHYVGYSTCLAVDEAGDPHITYMDTSSPHVKYAVRNSGRWRVETVDSLARTGYPDRNSIALDEEGNPYLGYYDAGRGLLKVAHRESGKWLIETVDGNGAGFTSSLQIGGGTLWISYADDGSGGLKVAHRALEVHQASPSSQMISGKDRLASHVR